MGQKQRNKKTNLTESQSNSKNIYLLRAPNVVKMVSQRRINKHNNRIRSSDKIY